MKPCGKAYSIIFSLTLVVAPIAYGAGDNPFVEEERSKSAILPPGKGDLKGLSGGFRPGSLNEALPFAQSPAPQPLVQTERKWKIKGKINDTVVISDEKGERIHVRNGEVFDGCLIQFPSALCDRDTVIKTLQEKYDKEKQEKAALSRAVSELTNYKAEAERSVSQLRASNELLRDQVSEENEEKEQFFTEMAGLKTALDQKEKERAGLSRVISDLSRKNNEADNTLQQLRNERDILSHLLKEAQAARERSLKEIEDLYASLQEKEAAAAKATAEAVKHKTDAQSLLEMAAQREQCSTEMEQIRSILKEREAEALGAGILVEYVQRSGERVPTEEYGEIIIKEMNDSLIIGVSRGHLDQAERSLAKAAKARIVQEQFIFYLLEKGSVDFTPLPSGEAVRAVQGQRAEG